MATSRASALTSRPSGWSKLRSMKAFISSVVELGDEAHEPAVAGWLRRFRRPARPRRPSRLDAGPHIQRRCRRESRPVERIDGIGPGSRSSCADACERVLQQTGHGQHGRPGVERVAVATTRCRPARPGPSERSSTITARPAPAVQGGGKSGQPGPDDDDPVGAAGHRTHPADASGPRNGHPLRSVAAAASGIAGRAGPARRLAGTERLPGLRRRAARSIPLLRRALLIRRSPPAAATRPRRVRGSPSSWLSGCLGRRPPVDRRGHEGGVLAFAQVVAGRLAGHRWVAVDPENVIA